MELLRALAALVEHPGPAQRRLADLLGLPAVPDPAQYTDLFVFQLYPYASVYLGVEGMLGGEAQDRVAGFWRALKLVPPPEPDHLTALLALYATLAEQEEVEPDPAHKVLWRRSRQVLLWEHLASWLFPYLDKLEEIAPPLYRVWGEVLREALLAEVQILGPPATLPLHFRHVPSLSDPREAGLDQFLQDLLAPVLSGLILVRADLARAAREMGLGLRLSERRFMLKSLLSQDPENTLRWLTHEAQSWASRHLRFEDRLGGVARFWAQRAKTTAALLADLQASAREVRQAV